ncbi:HAD-IA family hydrolase, partial [Aminobacter sp. J15]|uniref:HAD family hydrolase n=2 Tax=unclassified Aminobacter TaxID=2644704 RepID=UPI0011A3ECCD
IRYLSFDVFDTLICRPTENPSDVFHLLQLRLERELGLRYPDFARIRIDAENEARDLSANPEIDLDLIYDIVAERLSLSKNERAAIMSAEIALEISLISPRKQGSELWRLAKMLGKPIVLISDMYLPEPVIAKMLEKAGFSGYDYMFVSSSAQARKKDGALFDVVLQRLAIRGDEILHVGDHIVADVRNAQSRGMTAIRTPRAIDLLKRSPGFKEIYGTSSGGNVTRSAIVGLTARQLFDRAFDETNSATFRGDPKCLGFAAFGPFYFGFVHWVWSQAKRAGVKRLYFLSREGYLLKQIFDRIAETDASAPQACYLYGSRRAIRVASISTGRDIGEVGAQPYSEGTCLGNLIEQRFGLPKADFCEFLTAAGIDADTVLERSAEGRRLLARALKCLEEPILRNAAEEREAYLSYLHASGLSDNEKVAVVDLGWMGNMQGGLGKLLGRPLIGYYLATLAGSEVWEREGHELHGYLGEGFLPNSNHFALKRRHLLEVVTCHTDNSLLRIVRENGEHIPIFRSEQMPYGHVKFVSCLHAGVVDFAEQFVREYSGFLPSVSINPELAGAALLRLFKAPERQDAEAFRELVFEDGFGGVEPRRLLSDAGKWPEATSVLKGWCPTAWCN